MELVECFGGVGFGLVVSANVDVDYAARRYVWWEQYGRELDLRGGQLCVNAATRRPGAGTYKAFIFSQENGDTGVDLADCQRYQHYVWVMCRQQRVDIDAT